MRTKEKRWRQAKPIQSYAVPAPWCLLLSEVGTGFEDRDGPALSSPAAKAIADVFFELVAFRSSSGQESRLNHRQCLVLTLRFFGFPTDRAIRSVSAVRRAVGDLIAQSLDHVGRATADLALLGASDAAAGQILGSVIMLGDLTTAQAYRVHASKSVNHELSERRRARIREILESDKSLVLANTISALKDLRQLVHEEMAARLAPALNSHLQTMPSETYADKQAIAIWVNSQLRELGLAVRCPETGLPGILVADTHGAGGSASRIRVDVRGDDGRRTRRHTLKFPLNLSLIAEGPRIEGLAQTIRR